MTGSEKSVSSSEGDRWIRYAGEAVRRRFTSFKRVGVANRVTSRGRGSFLIVGDGVVFRFLLGGGTVEELCVRRIDGPEPLSLTLGNVRFPTRTGLFTPLVDFASTLLSFLNIGAVFSVLGCAMVA